MIFNSIEVNVVRGDRHRFSPPLIEREGILKVLYDDTASKFAPGQRRLKRGKYVVVAVRDSFAGAGQVYGLKRQAKNSRYIHYLDTAAIDKAVDLGLIELTV